MKSVLLHTRDHPLFRHFLYPCIKRDTLSKIGDTAIFDHAFSYLHDCCKKAEETMDMINYTYNQYKGNLTRPLCSWDNISADEEKKKLCSFLKEVLGWDWVDNAEVSKTEDGNSIRVAYELNSALITLNPDKRIATLSFKGKQRLEFIVDTSRLLTSEQHGGQPAMSVGVHYESFFKEFLHMRAQQLIFSMLSNYGPELGYLSVSIRILSHDSKFMQELKETKDEFEKRYTFFMGRQKNHSG